MIIYSYWDDYGPISEFMVCSDVSTDPRSDLAPWHRRGDTSPAAPDGSHGMQTEATGDSPSFHVSM